MEDSGDVYTSVCEADGHPTWESSRQQQQPHQGEAEHLRRKIKFYFMNPCEKYRARGRKPWKLVLQLVKIAIITIQLVSFGLSNQMVVTFKEDNLITFNHLFLKDYVDGGMATYAVYRQTEVYEHIDYIIDQFGLLRNITLGNHAYEKDEHGVYTPMSVCQEYYSNGTISPANETFDINAEVESECFYIDPMYPVTAWGRLPGFHIPFERLLCVTIQFVLKAINLQTVRHQELPDCYDFTVTITFNNLGHSGRIKVDLDTDVVINNCINWNVTGVSPRNIYTTLMLDCFIVVVCIVSLCLCGRSVFNGIQLQCQYTAYCREHDGKVVSWSDQLEFLNGWYILIIISDMLTIIGSVLKIEIQIKLLTSYDVCSIFLGTGTMLVWVSLIRYMGYFKKYNILILTLRAAFPNVIRFICCAGIIYLGYCFCGWIVLGPYHEKFRTLNTVSECLFSLINGDDMFPTFNKMKQKSQLVWVFSRVYLYTFVSLFIYMILSLFITLITNTYDTIKQQQQSGLPTSDVQRFISECKDLPNSGVYRLDQKRSSCLLGCCMPRCMERGDMSEERLTSEA